MLQHKLTEKLLQTISYSLLSSKHKSDQNTIVDRLSLLVDTNNALVSLPIELDDLKKAFLVFLKRITGY
jgi:hypothetical protein